MRRESERVKTPDPEGGKPYEHGRTVVRVAMSVCAPVDRFVRHVGIARAVGRLDSATQSTTADTLSEAVVMVFGVHPRCDIDTRRANATFDAQRERLLRDSAPKDDT